MSKVVIIFTGGTISMHVDPTTGAAVPALTGDDILAQVPGISRVAEVEVDNFGMYPGPHMTFELMGKLFASITQHLGRPDVAGVVVTHGTDSLEETAYFCDCLYDGQKPIVFTGAMKNSSQLGWDGPANLFDAVRTAADPAARGLGVLVVLAREIHAAQDVTKTHTHYLDTFKSLDTGPVGLLDKDTIIYIRTLRRQAPLKLGSNSVKVALLKAAADMDGELVDYCVRSGYRGIVVEGMGRGNIPPRMADALITAVQQGVIAVLCSRCHSGRVLDTYGYPGAAKPLTQAGVILGGSLNGQKARIKLMLGLSAGLSWQEIACLF